MPDLKVVSYGKLIALRPVSDLGRDWLDEHRDAVAERSHGFVFADWQGATAIVNDAVAAGLQIE
jgi:hypothetical protein